MASSPSVNPERGLVPAAEFLAAYAAMPTRSTVPEVFSSILDTQDKVDALCKKYGVPQEFTGRPAGDLRANSTPPPGSICVYARSLEAGMPVPLHGFFREALSHFGIAPAQLTPNGWRFMAGFLAICRSAGVPPSLAVFLRFFTLYAFDRKHRKGWYFFRCRRDNFSLRFTGMPSAASKSIDGWKHDFFFLSSPEPWNCAVEWGEPSNRCSKNLRLTVEETKSAVKLISAHGGGPVDLRNLLPAKCSGRRCRLCDTNLCAAMPMIATASPPPPPSSACCSKGMDPSVHDMMKTVPAKKVAAQASAKKRTWEEANGIEEVLPLSVLHSVHSPPPHHYPSRNDGHTADWEAALERAFGANEPTDDAAIRQAANYVIELEEKLVGRDRDAATLREQLEGAKKELASAKLAADAEREKARSDLAAAGAELEKTKAELAAAKRAVDAEGVKTKAELAAARAEAVKTKAERTAAWEELDKTKAELAATKRSAEAELVQARAELTAAKRAAETELVKTKAKLTAVEAELESAKAAAVQQLLASEEHVRQSAEDALEGYKRWRGHHAPAGRAA
ncbi:hypothetical protein ZWY2020_050368 [Hordeum vulgare]|nr:hypothetical protein ZWY2020_050368 [Hordeum vulgare]